MPFAYKWEPCGNFILFLFSSFDHLIVWAYHRLAVVDSWEVFFSESEENAVSSFSSDKATVFSYNEVCDATSNFSTSLKIGQGSYGSVYLGKLRGTVSAIYLSYGIFLNDFSKKVSSNNTLFIFGFRMWQSSRWKTQSQKNSYQSLIFFAKFIIQTW